MNSLPASAQASSASCSRGEQGQQAQGVGRRLQALPKLGGGGRPFLCARHVCTAPHLVDLEVALAVSPCCRVQLRQAGLDDALQQRFGQVGVGRLAAAAACLVGRLGWRGPGCRLG